jgi:competence protein ComEA
MAEHSVSRVATWVLMAAVIALALWRMTGWGDGDAEGSPVRFDRSPAAPGAPPGEPGGTARKAVVFVHVAGAVRRPGLVRVPSGSRAAAAVDRAGGATRRADLAGVNLAARVEDGQQVIVPVRVGALGAGATADGEPGLGTATVDQLDELDGIGPTLAERIVEYRTDNGGFRSIEELREVEGIGEKRFESLREAVQP